MKSDTAKTPDAAKSISFCRHSEWTALYKGVGDFEHRSDRKVDFFKCDQCDLISQRPVPSPDELKDFYPPDYRAHVASNDLSFFARKIALLKNVQASLYLSKCQRYLPEKNKKILEIGCGVGHLLRQLKRKGYSQIHGVDFVDTFGPQLRAEGIAFTACDVERGLPLKDRFHTIVMNYVIEHFTDPERVLRACLEILEPGGQLLVLTPNSNSLCHQWFTRFWSGLHVPRHIHVFNPPSFRSLAQSAGCQRVEISYPVDPGSWMISFQNLVEVRLSRSSGPRHGTRLYAIACLPFFLPFAWAESLRKRGSSLWARVT